MVLLLLVTLLECETVPTAGSSSWKEPLETSSDSSKFKMAVSGLTTEIPVNEF